jgi:hypothetical protein
MERLKEYSVSIMGLKVEGISTENTDNIKKARRDGVCNPIPNVFNREHLSTFTNFMNQLTFTCY